MPVKANCNYTDKPHPFPQIMSDREDAIWLVTHDQDVGLAMTLLKPMSGDEIGYRRVIDDETLMFLTKIDYSITLRNE